MSMDINDVTISARILNKLTKYSHATATISEFYYMMGFYSFCEKCCGFCFCLESDSSIEPVKVPSKGVVSSQSINADLKLRTWTPEEVQAHSKDKKNIYAYAVEAMARFLGKPAYPFISQPKQLYPYILYLCEGLQEQEIATIKESVLETQPLNIQLTVVLKDARVIHPKITEFSQIFCKLRTTNGQELLTTTKETSSYLLWDETFILDILNYESDAFHIEFWSSRPDVHEKLPQFQLESFKEDDPLAEEKGMYFVGDAVEYVKSLPCKGENMLWSIKKGPRRICTKGQVNIYVQLGAQKDPDFLLHLYCHIAIIRLCFEKQVVVNEESPNFWKNWLEVLPNTALTLIQQHALQHGISPVEQCLCSWLVISSLKMRHEDRLSFCFLKDVLSHLLKTIDEDAVGPMKEVFCKNIYDFSVYTVDMLRNLHNNFDVQNTVMADELYYMLRCISSAELKSCEIYMDSYQSIEEEASQWYLQVIAEFKDDLEKDDSIVKMSEGLKSILKIFLKNQIILDDIFSRAWNVLYSCISYKKLDEVVCVTIQPMIKHLMLLFEDPTEKRNTMESLKMLQLYHTARNLVNYMSSCIPTQRAILRMDEYSTWFGESMVVEWFLLCDIYTGPFIHRAVLADSMERLSSTIVHGTSVPDVASIMDEMVVEVWMKLQWKDQFYTHGALLEAVKSCVLYYNRSIFDRIRIENYFCRTTDFDMNKKLCVALSNVYAMSEQLNKIKIKIKKELKTAESALGFHVFDPMMNIQSEMQFITAESFILVFEKIRIKIKKFVKTSVKTKPENLKPGSGDLCAFIDNTLEIMYSNLKSEVFHLSLRHIWIVTLICLKKGLNYGERCFISRKRKLNIYLVTLRILNQMKAIFFCDGHGLTHYEMENTIHEQLKLDLEVVLQTK